ncbi:phospholipase D-like domain-containing protein [Aeromicrobium duanguangcaii]|uniref:phospholipase D n=1 Tax=Aeromicrobium duanguangcaii TaxID=2968086 RepID=A0ABY5KAA4_9ACTN|nr:phospholipase D-like domain-containing protein [Aeromicrobium duanguangcaii]UUI67369.1 phospholipase D-like domain-containing protein [Aeromicrobium duanguangcaii]
MSVSHRLRLAGVAAVGALVLPLVAASSTFGVDEPAAAGQASSTEPQAEAVQPQAAAPAAVAAAATPDKRPYGAGYPVEVEANFSRPYFDKGGSNRDYSLLNDLERLIRGSYQTPAGKMKSKSQRRATSVFAANSRMEDSVRVGRELVKAAKAGVNVRFIHPNAHQSPASNKLKKQLNKTKYGKFKTCSNGKSMACLSRVNGALMHSKIVMVSDTYTRSGKRARGVVWTGSTNFGGRSAERTYNNGTTVYNDKKLWYQMRAVWNDMWAKRRIGKDYGRYIAKRNSRYGYSTATRDGYTSAFARRGVLYSNLSNYAIHVSPLRATPTNGRDPILNVLNRIVPDEQCRIRVMENRFKYRRIALAYKLAALNNGGCRVSVVGFKDDNKKNYLEHCRQLLRVCKPILDVLKTSRTEVDAAYAQIHDKTILIDAKLKPNKLNPEERLPNGRSWPKSGSRVKVTVAGSANLTGSNLVASDEITTITSDPDVYDAYVEHWRSVTQTKAYGSFKY